MIGLPRGHVQAMAEAPEPVSMPARLRVCRERSARLSMRCQPAMAHGGVGSTRNHSPQRYQRAFLQETGFQSVAGLYAELCAVSQ